MMLLLILLCFYDVLQEVVFMSPTFKKLQADCTPDSRGQLAVEDDKAELAQLQQRAAAVKGPLEQYMEVGIFSEHSVNIQ
jgi:hypothetical protein